MTADELATLRHSVIAAILRRQQSLGLGLGQTALMKLVYFLQTIRGVPLGYYFQIYTYGPYDDQVLDDLQTVESRGGARSEFYEYEYGTGYRIFAADKTNELARTADNQLALDLDWVVGEFGKRNAVDLEMASTIVFTDRQNANGRRQLTVDDMANTVYKMKPQLDIEHIVNEVRSLKSRELLRAVA